MSEEYKALEIFNKVDNVRLLFTSEERSIIKQALQRLEKLEKALEIIREKEVYIYSLRDSRILSHYNNRVYIPYKHKLTQEEFDLLKEVIKQ